jgi:hypothetical protein
MKNYQQLTVEPSFSCIQLSGPKCVNCAKSLNWNLPFYLFLLLTEASMRLIAGVDVIKNIAPNNPETES